jgi:hypothetical protein
VVLVILKNKTQCGNGNNCSHQDTREKTRNVVFFLTGIPRDHYPGHGDRKLTSNLP